jgi:hypothetical protein
MENPRKTDELFIKNNNDTRVDLLLNESITIYSELGERDQI